MFGLYLVELFGGVRRCGLVVGVSLGLAFEVSKDSHHSQGLPSASSCLWVCVWAFNCCCSTRHDSHDSNFATVSLK